MKRVHMLWVPLLLWAASGCEKSVTIRAVEPAAKEIVGIQRLAMLDLAFSRQPTVGRNLANTIVAELNQTGAFEVMERSAVAGVLEEQDFALAEAEDATEVSVIGKLLGVDGVIVGEVIAYEISSSYVSIGANLRLVDVQSARVVYSDSITRHHQGNVSETRQSTVLNELSQMLAAEFVRQIAPHYIERRKYLLSTGGDASQANDRGMKFATNGLWDKAEEQFNQAKWIDPGSAAVLNNLAIVYEQSGRLNEAVEAYEAAIKLDPDKDAIQKNYATLRRTFRDHDTTPKRALEDQRSNSAEPRGPVESEESEDSASPRESEDAVIPVVPGVPGNSGNPGRPNQGAKR